MDRFAEIARKLRADLHTCPEPAFEEKRTKERILRFLREETLLEVTDCGCWIWAKWTGEDDRPASRLALRADFDAVTGADGRPGHYCGHDGHAALLCGLAGYISESRPKRSVYLIFQPAEEIGEGARLCRKLLKEEKIPEIYGLHNIPGFPKGTVLVRQGTFACASTGLELKWTGESSHAAYPENGRNPAGAVAELVVWIRERLQLPHKGILLCTVIGAEMGSSAYGVSAGDAVLRLTVRGENPEEFERFLADIREKAEKLAAREGLQLAVREIERFPATVNGTYGSERVVRAAALSGRQVQVLSEPMRWSEDFGYYLQEAEGAFFGIGDGEDYPQLHTQQYSFPDEIIPDALALFAAIAES